jgi:eukaryotic-like serine/threonine-protein kinase
VTAARRQASTGSFKETRTVDRFKVIREFPVREPTRRVQLAEDRLLHRQVILKSDADQPVIEHEASLLARCASCHVVACYDLLKSAAAATCIIEYFSGDTLQDVLVRAGGRLDPRKALVVANGLLLAFQDLNRAGILHRDLHPGHISYADRDRLKVFDLGLAVGFAKDRPVPNPHAAGTWETMAPEEFAIGAPLGAPTNVYSAASLIYRLIVGHYPLEYQRMVKDWRALSGETQKLRQRELHLGAVPDLDPLPQELRGVFRTALAKRPEDRFATVGRFREALLTLG